MPMVHNNVYTFLRSFLFYTGYHYCQNVVVFFTSPCAKSFVINSSYDYFDTKRKINSEFNVSTHIQLLQARDKVCIMYAVAMSKPEENK